MILKIKSLFSLNSSLSLDEKEILFTYLEKYVECMKAAQLFETRYSSGGKNFVRFNNKLLLLLKTRLKIF